MIEKMRKLVAERTGAEVTVLNVTKNNGVKLTGINVKEEGKAIAPMIYVDGFLEQIRDGNLDMMNAVEEIVSIYKKCKDKDYGIGEMFTQFRKYILERVEYRLVNKELNKKMLENMPHRDLLDLAVTYAVVVSSDADGQASFRVKNEMLGAYGISIEELDRAAAQNTNRVGFKTASMDEIMLEITGCNMEMQKDCPRMYVLSNESGVNGANVMLFRQPFEELAEKCGSDLYILPSSIHEIIAIPASSDVSVEELKWTVGKVNCFEVSEQERLSRTVYRYSKENHEISIAV